MIRRSAQGIAWEKIQRWIDTNRIGYRLRQRNTGEFRHFQSHFRLYKRMTSESGKGFVPNKKKSGLSLIF